MPGSLVLYNGKVHPLTGIVHCTEAVSIRDEHILRLGSNDRVRDSQLSHVVEIDLQGKTVLPSFSDNLGCLGREIAARTCLDLTAMRSMPEIFAVIEQATRKGGSGDWITGYGWDKSQWGWQRFPHRADLDLVSPHHPVALLSSDGRVAWLNSAGLVKAGIRRDTPPPPGGEIQRDPITGAATGILLEKAVSLISDAFQKPSIEEAAAAFTEITKHYHSLGITSISSFETLDNFAIIRDLAASQAHLLNMTCHVSWPGCQSIADKTWHSGLTANGLTLGGVWSAVDGTLNSQTALMMDPYVTDWDMHGIEITPEDELREMARWCLDHQFSPVFLASGDAGCHHAARIISSEYHGQGGPHPFIAYGDLIHTGDLDLLRRLDLGLLTDPRRLDTDRETGERCWGARWNKALDLSAWRERGVALYFGSSGPIRHWSPMKALSSSLVPRTRHERDSPLDVEAGLLAITRPLSYRKGEEGGGLLSPGQYANLVVLSENPFQVAPKEVASIQVEMTIYRGHIVYDRHAKA